MKIQTQQDKKDVFWPSEYRDFVAVLSDVTTPMPETALCSPCILVLWLLWIERGIKVGRLVNGFPILVYYLGPSIYQWLSHYSHTEHLHPISQASTRRAGDSSAVSLWGSNSPFVGSRQGELTLHIYRSVLKYSSHPLHTNDRGFRDEGVCTYDDLKI